MKRFQILVVALFAVFAFGVVVASSAMAEEESTLCVAKAEGLWGLQSSATECAEELATANSPFELVVFLLAEWLVAGLPITTTLLVTSTSSALLLEDKEGPLGAKGMVLCSGILDGTIGPSGEDEITELLRLDGVTAVSLTALSGNALLCDGQEGCLTGTENAEVWAVNLPWLTLLELVEEASPTLFQGFADLILPHTGGGQPGWYTFCSTLLGNQEDECKAPEAVAQKTNVAGGVLDTFSAAFTLLVGAQLGLCTASGEKIETGVVEETGETVSSEGVLSASSVG